VRVLLSEIAYAKINLALHIRTRREDGYHELETLFAFVDDGDKLEVLTKSSPDRGGGPPEVVEGVYPSTYGTWSDEVGPCHDPAGSAPPPAEEDFDTLTLHGEFAYGLSAGDGNIVSAALAALPHDASWSVRLDKRLPVAAGLGGGSADAGAVFRLIAKAAKLPEDWHQIAARLGADVPACVASRTVLGRGTGTELAPGPDDLAGCPVLLVNPRVPLSTGPVFKAWDRRDLGPLPQGTAREIALTGRNDLEAPALTLCPPIAEVLTALRNTAPWLARMSGSGATCFALYDNPAQRDAAATRIATRHPGWWQMTGALR
jgi:4-diphosphocytidyl-2-C-methyl-D-erythritol kinase